MEDNYLVSVVVPIYNVERYLLKCIDSITSQTYKKIEIILVDDGSSDNCPNICDSLMQNDRRITVIHKENGGLSDARNVGIDNAKGEYILFIDSDDFIHPDMVKDLLYLALKHEADIVECGVTDVNDGKTVKWQHYTEMNEKIYYREEALEKILDYKDCRIVAWNKLYKLNLFSSIKYPVGKIHEDEFTTPYLIEASNKYVLTPNQYYAYVKRSNSIMRTKFNEKRLHSIEAHKQRLEYFSKKYNEKYDEVIKYHYFVAISELKDTAKASGIHNLKIVNLQVGARYSELYYGLVRSKIKNNKKLKLILYRYLPKLAFTLRK